MLPAAESRRRREGKGKEERGREGSSYSRLLLIRAWLINNGFQFSIFNPVVVVLSGAEGRDGEVFIRDGVGERGKLIQLEATHRIPLQLTRSYEYHFEWHGERE